MFYIPDLVSSLQFFSYKSMSSQQYFRVLANFFAVRGQKKKGYLCDSTTMKVCEDSSVTDFFRGRSNIFEATLSSLHQPQISCFVYMKERLYRLSDFDLLNYDDVIYICEEENKDRLEAYLSPKPPKPESVPTAALENSNNTNSLTRKRKREQNLFDKLTAHLRRKGENEKEYKKGQARQQYLERETVDKYRQYKGLSLVQFDEEYGDLTWKRGELILLQ